MGQPNNDRAALRWAGTVFPYTDSRLVSRRPWSTIYEMKGDATGQAFLKIDHGVGEEAAVLTRVAVAAPAHAPAIIAADSQRGWLLLQDHCGLPVAPDDYACLLRAIKVYAAIQASLAEKPASLAGLRHGAPASALLDSLLQFLSAEDRGAEERSFVSQDLAQSMFGRLHAQRSVLLRLMAGADLLPLTINHNDLHHGNLALRPDGTLVLCDWSDALVGPAGMSLGIFGGPLAQVIQWSQDAGSQSGGLRLAYATALAEKGYASSLDLQAALGGAALRGVVERVVAFAAFANVRDPRLRRLIRWSVEGGLQEIRGVLTLPSIAFADRPGAVDFRPSEP